MECFPKVTEKREVALGSAPSTTVSRPGPRPRLAAFKALWGTSLNGEGLGAPAFRCVGVEGERVGCLPDCSSHSPEWPLRVWGGKGRSLPKQALGCSALSLSLLV